MLELNACIDTNRHIYEQGSRSRHKPFCTCVLLRRLGSASSDTLCEQRGSEALRGQMNACISRMDESSYAGIIEGFAARLR